MFFALLRWNRSTQQIKISSHRVMNHIGGNEMWSVLLHDTAADISMRLFDLAETRIYMGLADAPLSPLCTQRWSERVLFFVCLHVCASLWRKQNKHRVYFMCVYLYVIFYVWASRLNTLAHQHYFRSFSGRRFSLRRWPPPRFKRAFSYTGLSNWF